MQIEITETRTHTVLLLRGRLDVSWADHLLHQANDVLRRGQHRVQLDASGVDYLSSAGIRALLQARRDFTAVGGTLQVVHPSPFVERSLKNSGLEALLARETTDETGGDAATASRYETLALTPDAIMTGRIPCAWTPWHIVDEEAIRDLSFPDDTIGIGVGAPGRDAADCRSRFGEFLAVAGGLVWRPTTGEQAHPDYLVRRQQFIPSLSAIQAMTATGAYSHLIRFQPNGDTTEFAWSDLQQHVLDTVSSETAVMVCIGEIGGLVGVALSQSPGSLTTAFSPSCGSALRDWMTFCGERVHARQTALLVSFLSRHPAAARAPLLAPTPSQPDCFSHTHAVVWPFRPLPKGRVDVQRVLASFWEELEPLDLLHLIDDHRPSVGLGESTLIRGACWCAPLRWTEEAQ